MNRRVVLCDSSVKVLAVPGRVAQTKMARRGRLAPSVLGPPARRVRSHAQPGDRQVHQLRIDARPNAIHNRTLKTHDRRAPHAAKPEATRGDRHLQCTPRIAGNTSELVRASTGEEVVKRHRVDLRRAEGS